MKRCALLALLISTAGCDRGPAEVPAEVQQARRDARRQACASAELARTAEEDLQTLEQSFASIGDGPTGAITRQTGQAAIEYAAAYRQHALLRLGAAARTDSALNYSPTSADSARYAGQAEQFVISMPERGTVEANVIMDYERKIAALLADEDHPCNWDFEE